VRVRDELTAALASGQGVTAKVRWVSGRAGAGAGDDDGGRPRWLHCTPLAGLDGEVGAFMVLVIDEANPSPATTRFKPAPPVPAGPAPSVSGGAMSVRSVSLFGGGRSLSRARGNVVLHDSE
jgi:hypothetical protein